MADEIFSDLATGSIANANTTVIAIQNSGLLTLQKAAIDTLPKTPAVGGNGSIQVASGGGFAASSFLTEGGGVVNITGGALRIGFNPANLAQRGVISFEFPTTFLVAGPIGSSTPATISLIDSGDAIIGVQAGGVARVAETGYVALGAPASAFGGSMANSTVSFSLDEGGSFLVVTCKYSDGTVKTGMVPIS